MTDTITLPRSVVEQALEDLEMTINYVQSPTRREDMRDSIEALRAALEQPQDHTEQNLNMVPAGWKLVPVEPTDEMREAGKDAHYEAETRTSDADAWSLTGFAHRVVRASYIYRAMIAAAPQPPVVEQPQVEQEPVAWILRDANNHKVWFLEKTSTPTGYRGEWIKTPLYTHPQPRQPLTDEQIDKIADGMPGGLDGFMKGWGWRQFARAVEAHGIRGEE